MIGGGDDYEPTIHEGYWELETDDWYYDDEVPYDDADEVEYGNEG